MRAALCITLDGPDAIQIADIAQPQAGPGEVIVTVRTAALNFFDTLITRGKYQTKPDLPFSPAGEIAGVVEAVGEGVSGWSRGQRVMAYLGHGGAREAVAVPAERLIAIPDGVSDAVACGVPITYGTAIHGLRERAALVPGESVAVLGASGGAGLAAVEIAKLIGARVIAVASSADKLALARLHGADVGIEGQTGDLKVALRTAAGGEGVDVVYDCVGGPHAESAVRALAWGGRFLIIGFASGDIPKLPLNLLLLKGAAAIGVFWGDWVRRDPAGHRADMAFVLDAIARGRLAPHVHSVHDLADISHAIGLLDRREATGKVVIRI